MTQTRFDPGYQPSSGTNRKVAAIAAAASSSGTLSAGHWYTFLPTTDCYFKLLHSGGAAADANDEFLAAYEESQPFQATADTDVVSAIRVSVDGVGYVRHKRADTRV